MSTARRLPVDRQRLGDPIRAEPPTPARWSDRLGDRPGERRDARAVSLIKQQSRLVAAFAPPPETRGYPAPVKVAIIVGGAVVAWAPVILAWRLLLR